MLVVAIMSMFLAADTPGRASCRLAAAQLCEDTNQLVWAPDYGRALKAFVGTGKASWLYNNGSRVDQVREVLGGPPDDAKLLPDGSILFGACRAHSCDEKGAVIVKSGNILGVAVLNFHCSRTCLADPIVELIFRDSKAAEVYAPALRDWAGTATTNEHKAFPGVTSGVPPTFETIMVTR